MNPLKLTRRKFVVRTSASVVGAAFATQLPVMGADGAVPSGPFQAMGTRVGEVSDATAIVWTRLTATRTRNNDGVAPPREQDDKRGSAATKITVPIDQLEGACPGSAGRVQVRYGTRADLSDAQVTPIKSAAEDQDFICHFALTGLKPATVYHYVSEIVDAKGVVAETAFRGRFCTAPSADTPSDVRFCVMTCQGYDDRGHPDGHDIYPAMMALNPQFTCLTGDLVYYDRQPFAVTTRLARYHWERMFSLPRLMDFISNHSTYWLKDDHDTVNDDSSPGSSLGDFTFAEGQAIFRQQAPMPADGPSYRTVRWGRDLQVWFSEGRDYRSRNQSPDGPDKTIWGEEQKAWFKKTVLESDATWKILVSPTPLVGPDRDNKRDNHANQRFQHEGDELRTWMQANVPDNFFVITGDRHWQYHSVHPTTGVREFSVGPASDAHAGGSPGENRAFHKFHRVKGGFLAVSLSRVGATSRIQVEHRDVLGKVVHSWNAERPV